VQQRGPIGEANPGQLAAESRRLGGLAVFKAATVLLVVRRSWRRASPSVGGGFVLGLAAVF
jgi:hypothetical protein